jgi:RND superfamily putative drug exporter
VVFERLGRQMYRRRRLVLGIWALILLGSLPVAPRLPGVLKAGGFANGTSESDRAVALLQDDLHWYASTLTIIYTSSRLTVRDAAFERAVRASVAPLRRLPHVARIETYWDPYSTTAERMSASGGHRTYAIVDFDIPFDRVQSYLPEVRRLLHGNGLSTILTGDPVIYDDIERLSTEDLKRVETFTFPVAMVLLVLVFGTLVASAVPVALGGASVLATLALLYVLAGRWWSRCRWWRR